MFMTKPTNRGQILRDWITYRVKIQCKQLDNATKCYCLLLQVHYSQNKRTVCDTNVWVTQYAAEYSQLCSGGVKWNCSQS